MIYPMTNQHSPRSKIIIVRIPQGIHARVAARIVEAVGQLPVLMTYNNRQVNGHSMLDILSLCVPCGASVEVIAPAGVLAAIEQCLSHS